MAGHLLGLVVVLAAGAQDQPFESSEYGVRLRIPAGWTIDATRQPRVMLKLTQSVDSLIKPELILYEAPSAEPVTLGQYKEQMRHFLQRAYKDPRMLDDHPATAGGRPGFVLVIASRGTNDTDVVSYKGLFELSPRRMLGVDGVFQKGKEAELSKVFDALLGTIEFFPRKLAAGAEEDLKRFDETVEKLAQLPPTPPRKDELEINAGGRVIGTYTFSLAPGREGDLPGTSVDTRYSIDLGDDGKVETVVQGFLSNDLSFQKVETTDVRMGKDKRTQNFQGNVEYRKGEVHIVRRINGERSETHVKVPQPTILSELAEALQVRLLDLGKRLVALRSLPAFENETGLVKFEVTGLHKMKSESSEMSEVNVSFMVREDGLLITYWFDAQSRLARISHPNQSVVMKPKK
jgi:hypothetical protein